MLCVDLKLMLYFVNCILFLVAIILITLGIYCSKIPGPSFDISSPSIVLGSFICFLTIVGVVATKLHQYVLNICYLIFIMCIFGGQVVFGINTLAINDKFEVQSFLRNVYSARAKDKIDANVLRLQTFFECCGYDGPDGDDVVIQDVIYVSKGHEKPKPYNATYLIPECCPNQRDVCTKLDSYKNSCFDKMKTMHQEWTTTIGIFLVLSCFIVLIVAALTARIISVTQQFDIV